MIAVDDRAPDFQLPTDKGDTVSLASFRGRTLVLYFYPRDDTPGCTKQAIGFSSLEAEFDALGADILGVSKDTVEKHAKFRAKHEFTIPLGSDEAGDALNAYGVWVEKNMYGRKSMGIERSTFVIDGEGIVRHVWRKVRVAGHMEKVLEAVQNLG